MRKYINSTSLRLTQCIIVPAIQEKKPNQRTILNPLKDGYSFRTRARQIKSSLTSNLTLRLVQARANRPRTCVNPKMHNNTSSGRSRNSTVSDILKQKVDKKRINQIGATVIVNAGKHPGSVSVVLSVDKSDRSLAHSWGVLQSPHNRGRFSSGRANRCKCA